VSPWMGCIEPLPSHRPSAKKLKPNTYIFLIFVCVQKKMHYSTVDLLVIQTVFLIMHHDWVLPPKPAGTGQNSQLITQNSLNA